MAFLRLLLWLIGLPTLFILARRTYRLFVNYRVAQKLNVPIIVLPISWQDDIWLLCWEYFTWLKRIPFVEPWFDYTRFSWTQTFRFQPHLKYGDAFAIVAPGGVELIVNDGQAVLDIQTKYRVWARPASIYSLFNTFGNNVLGANGDDWQRHRRLINLAFQEPNHKLVWAEGRSQALNMRKSWLGNKETTTLDVVQNDSVVLAMHVLSAAAFGKEQSFESGVREVPAGHLRSLAETLSFMLYHTIETFLFHQVDLPNYILPKTIATVKECVADFNLYLREAIAFTRGLVQGGATTQAPELTTTLIKANEAAKREQKGLGSAPVGKPTYLTDDELLGNMFVFNLAGFETTANALTYSISYLAAHPDIQDWLIEELDTTCRGNDDLESLNYEETFPKFVRCLAVMVGCHVPTKKCASLTVTPVRNTPHVVSHNRLYTLRSWRAPDLNSRQPANCCSTRGVCVDKQLRSP
jgi:cytochrome P450